MSLPKMLCRSILYKQMTETLVVKVNCSDCDGWIRRRKVLRNINARAINAIDVTFKTMWSPIQVLTQSHLA